MLPHDPMRRHMLRTACAMGAIAGVVTVIPFIASMLPSERERLASGPVEVDLSAIEPGQMVTVQWRGQPVWVLHRTPEMLASLDELSEQLADPFSERPGFTPAFAKNPHRSIDPEWMVMVGICTHLGCTPTPRFELGAAQGMSQDWNGGYFCPCHGSSFDFAGRVFKHQPAPDNLAVPPYYFMSPQRLVIGLEEPLI